MRRSGSERLRERRSSGTPAMGSGAADFTGGDSLSTLGYDIITIDAASAGRGFTVHELPVRGLAGRSVTGPPPLVPGQTATFATAPATRM
jgi:hypothetical protein